MSASLGRKVAEGRNADVFEQAGGRLLRRYRDPARSCLAEAELMVHLASQGIPVPRVFDAEGPALIMERVAGPTMLASLGTRPWTLLRCADALADLHVALHRVPAPPGLRAPFGAGEVVCHFDLHPANVLMSPSGPVVIDWEGAVAATAAHDLAQSYVVITTSVVPGRGLARFVGTHGQGAFGRRLLASAGVPVPPAVLAQVAERRLEDANLLAPERARVAQLRQRSATSAAGGGRGGTRTLMP